MARAAATTTRKPSDHITHASAVQPQRIDRDLLVASLLYVVAAVWFLWLARGASAQGVITGEEASITHRDALSVALRWQPSLWSTNFGSQVFYWAAGHLTPDYGLLYARPIKAAAIALLAPLCYLVARRRLACTRPSAGIAGLTVIMLPGVSMLAWIGTENGLDAVWGIAGLLMVTSQRPWWPAGLVLAAVAVSNYPPGLAWLAVAVVVATTRIRDVRTAMTGAAAVAAAAAVLLFPLAWWRNGGVVVNGGTGVGGLNTAPSRLSELWRYTTQSGASYYYFSDLPALGGAVLVAALLAATAVAAWARWARMWPWLAAAVAGVGLYTVSGGVPGWRRLVVLAVVGALVAGVAVDVAARAASSRWSAVSGATLAAAAASAAVLIAIPCVPGTVAWRGEIAAGARVLPIDWPFPLDPDTGQTGTLARLDADLRAGRLTPEQVGDQWGGTRTLAMLYMLDQRAGQAPPIAPGDVLAYYRGSVDCQLLDGPRC